MGRTKTSQGKQKRVGRSSTNKSNASAKTAVGQSQEPFVSGLSASGKVKRIVVGGDGHTFLMAGPTATEPDCFRLDMRSWTSTLTVWMDAEQWIETRDKIDKFVAQWQQNKG